MPSCQSTKFYLNMPGDLGHMIILMSSTELTTWMNAEFVENLNLIFLSLKLKLEDFDQIAGWGPV